MPFSIKRKAEVGSRKSETALSWCLFRFPTSDFRLILFLLPLLYSCQPEPVYIDHPEFTEVFESRDVEGCFVLYDEARRRYHLYDSARCYRGFLPASTFKIPNSLISLETGAIRDTNEIIKWDGQTRDIEVWNRDHTLRSAFRVSCVPCYQQLAHRVGVQQMRYYLERIDYGEMKVDTNSLSHFWLRGPSRITPMEQIDFLRRLYHGQLPFSPEHMQTVKSIMISEKTDDYTIYGKTGWAVENRQNIGWWVGWVEKNGRPYFFATNIEAPDRVTGFADKRIEITKVLLEELVL